jgi:hypothetical protein
VNLYQNASILLEDGILFLKQTQETIMAKLAFHEYLYPRPADFSVDHYQPSPQPSSSSVSFGFISSFFAATGLAAGLAAGFLAAEAFDKPLGKDLVGFFWDWAASQPAKSGSPSSKGAADAVVVAG